MKINMTALTVFIPRALYVFSCFRIACACFYSPPIRSIHKNRRHRNKFAVATEEGNEKGEFGESDISKQKWNAGKRACFSYGINRYNCITLAERRFYIRTGLNIY
ncbi:hypothetical protein TcasGA2_TC003299 [Tribolium castaneum]|uniref:Uncharacterized protein n=1 Tax=Tribolium castaneum TaxID=7070 RepID=D6WEW3_TRICA|nr:hypothetical protein TcasGA2_TC003299 [Tribolium castaneum]